MSLIVSINKTKFLAWSLDASHASHAIFVYILQSKMGKTEKKWKENHATKATKNQKTKIWDERNIKRPFIVVFT